MEKFYSVLGNLLEHIINNYSDEIALALGASVLSVLAFIGSKIKNAYIAEAYQKLVVAVTVVQQTIVDDLKAKSADGKLTPEERAEVQAHAKKVFFEQFGIVGKAISTLFMGSLEKWFETQKEYILAEIKKKSLTTAPPSSPNSGQ